MDKTIRNLIKYRKKQRRRNIKKLPFVKWVGIFVLISVMFLGLSFIFRNSHPWVSNAFLSISCGCITGLSFYFLSNMRNNKDFNINYEYETLSQTFRVCMEILNTIDMYRYQKIYRLRRIDAIETCEEILVKLDELEDARNNIPNVIYDVVPEIEYDPLDRDNINRYRDRTSTVIENEEENDAKKAMFEISKELLKAADFIQELIREREDQREFIRNSFL